ncbi:MAG: trypsin-like peptidase domain-containing protein [Herpetosiphon sp.]|nr:trypsin-like peptidase domain-containing protein [Herpetosiphon sp.]
MIRDRLGWLLSGILIGVLLMVSCDVVNQQPTARPSVADAAANPTARPSTNSNPSPAAPANPTKAPSQGATIPNQQSADAYSDTVAAIYQKGNPSVVRIDVSSQQGESLGTGWVIDNEQGYIVTNHHVAGGVQSVIVNFLDGEAAVADLVGSDPDSDIAVIKVRDANKSLLVPVEVGDSSALRVGDLVVAIGNPYGENRTATAGIISAVRASKSEGGDFSIPGVLQTDAAINPGNSGGPLFNSKGEVIGMNTFILDPSGRGANIGLGYAVPVNYIKRVVPELIANGRYTHPYLGVSMAPLTSLAARQNNLPTKGVLVSKVVQGGPADNGGLQVGDVITAIEGQAVYEPGDIILYLEFNKKPGDTVTFTVARGNQQGDVQVTVAARP